MDKSPCRAQVVHRQLIAALEGDRPDGLQPDDSGAAGVMRHAELAEVTANINVMHRQAKRAQKDCSDLYLLLLLHKCAAAGMRNHVGLTHFRQGLTPGQHRLMLRKPARKSQ